MVWLFWLRKCCNADIPLLLYVTGVSDLQFILLSKLIPVIYSFSWLNDPMLYNMSHLTYSSMLQMQTVWIFSLITTKPYCNQVPIQKLYTANNGEVAWLALTLRVFPNIFYDLWGLKGHLTAPGSPVWSWARVSVCLEFLMFFQCLCGFPLGPTISFHFPKMYH